MRKIGVQALKANRHDGKDVSEEDLLAEETNPDSENSSRSGSDQIQGPQSPSSLNNLEPLEEEQGSSDYQTVMRLLEQGTYGMLDKQNYQVTECSAQFFARLKYAIE